MTLPKLFQQATNRNIVVTEDGQVGLGFDLPDGNTIRIALTHENGAWLCATLTQSLFGRLFGIFPHAKISGDVKDGSIEDDFP